MAVETGKKGVVLQWRIDGAAPIAFQGVIFLTIDVRSQKSRKKEVLGDEFGARGVEPFACTAAQRFGIDSYFWRTADIERHAFISV